MGPEQRAMAKLLEEGRVLGASARLVAAAFGKSSQIFVRDFLLLYRDLPLRRLFLSILILLLDFFKVLLILSGLILLVLEELLGATVLFGEVVVVGLDAL